MSLLWDNSSQAKDRNPLLKSEQNISNFSLIAWLSTLFLRVMRQTPFNELRPTPNSAFSSTLFVFQIALLYLGLSFLLL